MGKGYNNFMSKKPFHPASKDNIKRVWMAQQRDIDSKKKEDDMRVQYEKEQDLYNNRVLVAGSDSKDKLSLNFMYEAPAGLKKEQNLEIGESEPEYKFEWQRNAPRESFAKNNMDIRDQPFGIQVRNVRCLKCHKWGHVNTDRECPLFNSSAMIPSSENEANANGGEPPQPKMEQSELIKSMKEEQGLALKRSVYGNYGDQKSSNGDNQEMLSVRDPEVAFLDSLSAKEKKKLLKKLQKLTGQNRGSNKKSNHSDYDDRKVQKKKKKKKDKKESKKNRKDSTKDKTIKRERSSESESLSPPRNRYHNNSSDNFRKHRISPSPPRRQRSESVSLSPPRNLHHNTSLATSRKHRISPSPPRRQRERFPDSPRHRSNHHNSRNDDRPDRRYSDSRPSDRNRSR